MTAALITHTHWFLLLVALGLGTAALCFVLADLWADYVRPFLQRLDTVDGMVPSDTEPGARP